jgi:hypothetical protein
MPPINKRNDDEYTPRGLLWSPRLLSVLPLSSFVFGASLHCCHRSQRRGRNSELPPAEEMRTIAKIHPLDRFPLRQG